MLVRNKGEDKTCSKRMLLPERISPIAMRPVSTTIPIASVAMTWRWSPNWRSGVEATARSQPTSLAELHGILQTGFDWSGKHLHRFLIHGAAYGISCLGGIVFREDARGRRFPVSVCIPASVSAMNTTSRPVGGWTFGWSGLCPWIPTPFFRLALGKPSGAARRLH
jgi:hypothetical protein